MSCTAIPASAAIDPRRSSVDEIVRICTSGELHALIGISEDQHIEFKQQLDLSQVKDKHKLAKAIASLANADGGIVLIGITRGRDGRTRRDYAQSLNCLTGVLDLSPFYKVLNNLLYPSISVSVDRHPLKSDPDLAIISAQVEKATSERPVLVVETVSENLNGGTVFGYYKRDEDGTNYVKHGEVHSLIQAGERLREVGELKSAIVSVLGGIERIENRLSEIEGVKAHADRA